MTRGEQRSQETKRLRAALDEIIKERNYQLLRWTPEHDEGHTPAEWMAILAVYMGKAAMECSPYNTLPKRQAAFRKRVRQLGAICAAVLEATLDEEG